MADETTDNLNVFADVYPSPVVRTVSDAEIRATTRDLQSKSDSFYTLYKQSVADHESAFFKQIGGEALLPESEGETKLTSDMVDFLTEGVTDKVQIDKILREASNHGLARGKYISNKFKTQAKHKQKIMEAGATGAWAQGLAEVMSVADIASLGTTALAGATVAGPLGGAAAVTANVANRLRKSKRLALLASGTASAEVGALEYLRMKDSYDMTGGDVALSALLAGGLTYGAGALARRGKQNYLFKKFDESPAEMTDNELLELNDILKDKHSEVAINFDDFKQLDDLEAFDKVIDTRGAQFDTRTPKEMLESGEEVGVMRGGLEGFRKIFSTMANLAGESSPPTVRYLANKLAKNSTGLKYSNGTTSASPFAASELRGQLQARFRSRAAENISPLAEDYVKRTKLTENDFYEEVYDVIELGVQGSPEARQAAGIFQTMYRELGEDAVIYDVAGFSRDTLKDIKNYIPRVSDSLKIKELEDAVGADNPAWNELFYNFVVGGQPKLRANVKAHLTKKAIAKAKRSKKKAKPVTNKDIDKYIRRFSSHYGKTFRNHQLGYGQRLANDDLDMEQFEELLRDVGGFDADDIEFITDTISTFKRPTKGHKHARHRMRGDSTASAEFLNKNGEIVTIKFTDLLQRNASNLFDQYLFKMSGSIALARNGIDTNKIGSSFTTAKTTAIQEGATESQLKALDYLYESIKGTHIYRSDLNASTIRGLNRIRELNFVISMGMSGMSALMELPVVLMGNSFEVLQKTMPRYGSLIRVLKDGKNGNKVAREMMAGTGVGSDGMIAKFSQKHSRMEGELLEVLKGSQYSKLDEKLGKARIFMGMYSGLTGVTDVLRRISVFNYAVSWETAAQKGVLPYSKTKLELMGLNVGEAEEILQLVKKYATYMDKDKKVLEAINVEKWVATPREIELGDRFFLASRRQALHEVNEMDIGSVRSFFRSPIGMTFFQFLSFPLSTLEQQAMRLGVQYASGDQLEVARILLSSAFLGSMIYMSRVYLNSMGRSDQEEYLERNLSNSRLLAGTISQVGAASLGMYIFEVTTGISDGTTRALTPAGLSTFTNVLSGLRDVGESIAGTSELTETELRTFLRAVPFSSMIGARQLLNGTADILTQD